MRKPLPAEEHKRRHELARKVASEGGTIEELARELGQSVVSAHRTAVDARVTLARRRRKPHPQKQRVLDLAREGATSQEIMATTGVSCSSVFGWCRAAGVSLFKGRGAQKTTATFDVIAEVFHRPGQTDAEIARRVGCTRERVGQIRATLRDKQIVKT